MDRSSGCPACRAQSSGQFSAPPRQALQIGQGGKEAGVNHRVKPTPLQAGQHDAGNLVMSLSALVCTCAPGLWSWPPARGGWPVAGAADRTKSACSSWNGTIDTHLPEQAVHLHAASGSWRRSAPIRPIERLSADGRPSAAEIGGAKYKPRPGAAMIKARLMTAPVRMLTCGW